mgnify:CR=1 FL=1
MHNLDRDSLVLFQNAKQKMPATIPKTTSAVMILLAIGFFYLQNLVADYRSLLVV